MRQSWIKSVKLGSPQIKLGGTESIQVVVVQTIQSRVKPVSLESNQVVLYEMWHSQVKSGGPGTKHSVLDQIRWSWVNSVSPMFN